MTTDRELLQMALEALDNACGGRCNAEYNPCYQQEVAKTIRTALSRKALDDLAEIDRELGLDHMQPEKEKNT